jgi:hypothetical protein
VSAVSLGRNGGSFDSLRMRNSSATSSTSPVGILRLTVLAIAQLDRAGDGDDIFVAQSFGFFVDGGIALGVDDDLGDAGAVAQIDENEVAVVAPRLTQPMSTAFLPASEARSAPHI